MPALRASVLLIMMGGLWLALSALANEPRISIRSPGITAGAPAYWRVIVTLEPHKDNRVVVVEADGNPGEYHRTDIAAPGEQSWKIRQVPDTPFRLTAGCYTFIATVKDGVDDDAKVLARVESQKLDVIGHQGRQCPQP